MSAFQYPPQDPTPETDVTEYATARGLTQPYLRERLYLTYHSGDVVADARRFYTSVEFNEVVAILSRLGHPPGRRSHLLDVGCGNGVASYAFARADYRVTGIDLSEGETAGLGAARSLIGLDGADFRVLHGDMDAPPLTETFDVIYLRQALHHSPDPATTVRRLSTYHNAFRKAGLVKRVELYPFDSEINFYPGSYVD